MTNANKRIIASAIGGPIIMIALVFVSAGTFDYWQGILYIVLTISVLVASMLLIRKNMDLASERLKPGKGTKSWDKMYWRLATTFFFVTIILACLDVGRFYWSPVLPSFVYIIAICLYILGNAFFLWAKTTNRFFSSVVRIQTDRGHTVCQDGPYKYIRHPGYLGGLLYTIVTPLLLGSLLAMIPVTFTIIFMFVRTSLEDKTLETDLEGYKEYKEKVRYRIIPRIW